MHLKQILNHRVKNHFWLIRHGESVSNAGQPWPNTFTNPLTERGIRQSHQLSQYLIRVFPEKPALIVTSPYLRTKQTAEPALKNWPDVLHEEWKVQEYTQLCYQTRGLLDNDEKQTLLEDFWKREDPDYCDGPMAESFNNLVSRLDWTINKLRTLQHSKTLIFTHGFFLNALFFRLENLNQNTISMRGLKDYKEGRGIPNTCIFYCTVCKNGNIHIHSQSIDHLSENQGCS